MLRQHVDNTIAIRVSTDKGAINAFHTALFYRVIELHGMARAAEVAQILRRPYAK